ncbi:VOC family protein [Acetobacteraceae bacterium H6797]|nr:VOC family protein [Acetobacteraceae bacterium H6797]
MTATSTPMRMGRVVLTVHDLDQVADFYQRALGLHLLHREGDTARLGAGEATLLELRRDTAARARSPREAGLFHTAFLLPHRADLGRWAQHASESRIPVSGASDHLVSEAIYLNDPEGNGIEIYADRPDESWQWQNGTVQMATEPLDVPDLLQSAAGTAWKGAPEGTVVGHVHLQVGALPPAEAFYAETLGFDITCRYQGGTFYSSGGYHHHLATNIWNSCGATPRQMPSTGLSDVEIIASAEALAAIEQKAGATLADPWGTPISFTAKAG